jgi:hypothetical protein
MPFFLDILVRGDGIVHVFLSPIILIGPRVGNYPHFFIFWGVMQGVKNKEASGLLLLEEARGDGKKVYGAA